MPSPKSIVGKLVDKFAADVSSYTAHSTSYTEMEARAEFIDPLFGSLGWDMLNSLGLSNHKKDVIREESQPTESSSKRPDYTFRIAFTRKFFVEAKKPAVDISKRKESAFQVRSYGWTAGMAVSILTNFKTIRVYDTRTAPNESDDADVCLIMDFDYKDLVKRFDELNAIFGREAVAGGSIEARFGVVTPGYSQVNFLFLERINSWRLKLSNDLHSRYPSIKLDILNDLAQKVINRIIFLRMCEDRGIEGKDRLLKVADTKDVIQIRRLFKELDDRYNTGLFDVTNDPFQAKIAINTDLFLEIVEEIYSPKSPYSFSVLDAEFLGQSYELFLVKRLALDEHKRLILQDKPAYEGREVISTPQPLVDEIVRRTFSGVRAELLRKGKADFVALTELKVLDIAVGSSRFLLGCLNELTDAAIEYLVKAGDTKYVYERTKGDYRLSFEAKKQLLESCLYGIDIDYNAVEVSRFSLLVKLLEDESRSTLPKGKKILPNLDNNIFWGNSVVDEDFVNPDPDVMSLVHPLNWPATGLPAEFDAIVGNPPYVKTEEMKDKTYDEFMYYKLKYETPYKQFDKYFVFMERAISKLKDGGCIGMVVPNKWITIESGKKLRGLLADNDLVSEVVDFGNELLFSGKSIYVCLLALSKSKHKSFSYRHVDDYKTWTMSPSDKGVTLPITMVRNFGSDSWILPANDLEAAVLTKLYSNSHLLGDIATVFNGIQTSAEDVFPILKWATPKPGVISFNKDGTVWQVEESITKPYLTDSGLVQSYLPVEYDALIIFPYEFNGSGEPVLISPVQMAKKYPLTWKYLKHHEPRLGRRDISPPPEHGCFYAYGRHQALSSAFRSTKIIYCVNQLGNKYGYDATGIGIASGGTAGEVGIMDPRDGYSLEFILGLLNQRVAEFYLRKRGSPFRGGYYSRGTAVVKSLPVPKLDFKKKAHAELHDEITKLVKSLIGLESKYGKAIGRQKVKLDEQRVELKHSLKKLYDSLWGLKGEGDSLPLPGE